LKLRNYNYAANYVLLAGTTGVPQTTVNAHQNNVACPANLKNYGFIFLLKYNNIGCVDVI
jgi:hypothetical protein